MSGVWKPYSFQDTAVAWLLERNSAALFLSMGTGKSVITLTAVSELILSGAANACLFVCPIRVGLLTIPNQVARWDHLKWMKVVNMRDPDNWPKWERGAGEIFIINPEKLASMDRTVKGETKHYPGFVERFLAKRKKLPVDIFVLDESSTAKSHTSKRFNALRPYLHDSDRYKTKFKRRWILTGTPAPNSYLDLYSQIRLLDNGKRLGKSFHQFRQCHFNSDFMGWSFEIKEGAKEKIDAKISDLALVIRGEDHLDLPPCEVVDIDVNLPPKTMRAYRTLEKEYLVELETGEIEALSAAALVTKLAQATAGCLYDGEKEVHLLHDAKLKALAKIRKSHPKEPLLVMTSYVHERERLLEAFPDARQFHEKDMGLWQAGKIPMWVGDARSLCHGIDGLQVSGRIICWMTLTYSNEVYQQANARLMRIGQERPTIVYRVMAASTVDWAIAEALREKDDQQKGLMAAIHALQQLRASA